MRVIQDVQVLNLSHTKVLRAIDDLFLNCFSKQELTYFNEKSSEKLYQMYNEDADFPYKHRFGEILEHYKYMSANDIELSVACWDEDALPSMEVSHICKFFSHHSKKKKYNPPKTSQY